MIDSNNFLQTEVWSQSWRMHQGDMKEKKLMMMMIWWNWILWFQMKKVSWYNLADTIYKRFWLLSQEIAPNYLTKTLHKIKADELYFVFFFPLLESYLVDVLVLVFCKWFIAIFLASNFCYLKTVNSSFLPLIIEQVVDDGDHSVIVEEDEAQLELQLALERFAFYWLMAAWLENSVCGIGLDVKDP